MCLDYIKLNCYFDNVLTNNEKNLVEEHLLSCHKCRLSLNNLIVLNKTIKSLVIPTIQTNFAENVINKINQFSHPNQDELDNYCANNLATLEYNKINVHVEDCEKCRIIVNQIQNQSKNYFEQFDFKTSGNFLDGIFDKIDFLESEKEVKHISNTQISSYIDNYFDAQEKSEIDKHLSECEKCEQKAQMFGLVRNTVLNLTKPVIHFNFSKKVLEEIEPKKAKVINFSTFMRKFIPAASMVAGLLIVGTFITMNKTIVDEPVTTQAVNNITVRSEDFLFAPESQTYRTDSIDVLSDKSEDNSLVIEDIGL